MKKKLAVVLGLSLVLGLSACAGGKKGNESGSMSEVISEKSSSQIIVSETSSAVTSAENTGINTDEFFSLSAEEQVKRFAEVSNEEAYEIVLNSNDNWCVTAYDAVTVDNIKDFVIIYAKDDGTCGFNLDWPQYGGYVPETISSIGELDGTVYVDRDGGDGGYTLCYGKNEDGTPYTNSQRSVPKTHGEVSGGTMDIDLYKKAVDTISTDDSVEEKMSGLAELGFDEENAQLLLSDYEAWFGRTEISGTNNIADGARSVGHEVEQKYGYYGKTIGWKVSNLELEGGAGQMNPVFSWGTLKSSGIVSGVETVDIY